MGVEIERKFLIDETKLPTLNNGYTIKQGYIQTVDQTTVRIRIRDEEAFLTIKGKNHGATRLEFEYPIPLEDAKEMLSVLCKRQSKTLPKKVENIILDKKHSCQSGLIHLL